MSGSDDMSLRLLKAWVIYFHAGNTADRAEHRGDGWKSVNAMKRDGTLSSDEDLERMMRSGGPDVSLGKRRRLTGKSAASSSGAAPTGGVVFFCFVLISLVLCIAIRSSLPWENIYS